MSSHREGQGESLTFICPDQLPLQLVVVKLAGLSREPGVAGGVLGDRLRFQIHRSRFALRRYNLGAEVCWRRRKRSLLVRIQEVDDDLGSRIELAPGTRVVVVD